MRRKHGWAGRKGWKAILLTAVTLEEAQKKRENRPLDTHPFLGAWCPLLVIRSCFVDLLSVQMFFWWICGGESGLPVLFLLHLSSSSDTYPWEGFLRPAGWMLHAWGLTQGRRAHWVVEGLLGQTWTVGNVDFPHRESICWLAPEAGWREFCSTSCWFSHDHLKTCPSPRRANIWPCSLHGKVWHWTWSNDNQR